MPHSDNLTEGDLESCREFARLLKEARAKKGLKQIDVAGLVGTTDKTISAMKHGKMRVPVDIAIQAAKVFEVPASQILPKLKNVNSDAAQLEIMTDLSKLNEQNLGSARRMIRKLLDSQSD